LPKLKKLNCKTQPTIPVEDTEDEVAVEEELARVQ
jgi:small-conductance mechanosensitive channel